MFTLWVIPISLFAAAFIRGYTGFGFSAIVILVLSAVYPVTEIVPAVLLLDLFISLPLVASSWSNTDFSVLYRLLWATVIGVPLGLFLLMVLPETQLKMLVPSVILLLSILPHMRHYLAKAALSSPFLCGLMSGWTTSAVSAGGAPVVIYLRHSKLTLSCQRDTLITYLFLTTCLTVALGYAVNQQLFLLPGSTLLLNGLALLGILVGKQLVKKVSIPAINHGAYYLLITLSALMLIKSVAPLII